MKIIVHPELYAIHQVNPDLHPPLPSGRFSAILRREGEVTVVALESLGLEAEQSELGYRAFELVGPFPLDQVGVIASIVAPLASAQVPVFTLATYDTDVILVPGARLEAALQVLGLGGHEFEFPEA